MMYREQSPVQFLAAKCWAWSARRLEGPSGRLLAGSLLKVKRPRPHVPKGRLCVARCAAPRGRLAVATRCAAPRGRLAVVGCAAPRGYLAVAESAALRQAIAAATMPAAQLGFAAAQPVALQATIPALRAYARNLSVPSSRCFCASGGLLGSPTDTSLAAECF